MQTIHILSKLVNSIESNPTAISLLPWEDIRLCLSAELNCRSDIYPTAQLHKAQDLFSEMLADAQRHASANHTQSCYRPVPENPHCASIHARTGTCIASYRTGQF